MPWSDVNEFDFAKGWDWLISCADRIFQEPQSRSLTNFITQLTKLAVYTHLAQAMDDVKLGKVQDADKAYDDIIA